MESVGQRARPHDSMIARLAGSWWTAVLVLLLYYSSAVLATTDKSNTFDEIAHLTAGYTYWVTGEYRMQPENGNLPQRLAGLSLLGGGFELPSLSGVRWRNSDVYGFGDEFLFRLNGRRAEEMLLRGRAAMGLVGVATGLLVWLWSRSLFGPVAGLLSLVLFALCPSVLAHGPMITSDMTAALFFTASLGALWQLLHRISPSRLLTAGLSLGGMALAKPSAPVMIPMALLLILIRLCSPAPLTVQWSAGNSRIWKDRKRIACAVVGAVLLAAAIATLLIWLSYGFRFAAMQPSAQGGDGFLRPWDWVLENADLPRRALGWMAAHALLPEAYLYGTAQALRMASARWAFALGEHSVTGWWWFFPYAFLVKTPLPFLGVLLLSAAAALRGLADIDRPLRGQHLRSALYRTAPLWVLLTVYWAFALTSNLNIGHRHLLPTYPALLILAGAAAQRLGSQSRGMQASVLVLVVLAAADSLAAHPNYLAYFNPLIGKRDNAYTQFVDSTLDWGQDLPGLKRWLDEQAIPASAGPRARGHGVYISYFGTGNLRYYGVEGTILSSFLPQDRVPGIPPIGGGVFAVSASMLQGVYTQPRGPWTADHEQLYQRFRNDGEMRRLAAATLEQQRQALDSSHQAEVIAVVDRYAQLRTARLCAFLRQRQPEAQIGYSILLYRLTEDEARQALEGPPPELRARVADTR